MSTTTKTSMSFTENRHKKSEALPKETPRNLKLINATTPEEKSEAEILFEKIGTGKEHAIKVSHRDNNDRTARDFRELVSIARRDGDPIINEGDGVGYYRPDMERPEEAEAARRYIRSLLSRASKLETSAQCMAEALGGRHMDF